MTDEQRERKKAYLREWYVKNRERQIAKAAAWQQANPEKAAERKRAWVEQNPERRKEQASRHAAKAAARPAGEEWNRDRTARDAAELKDGFVRRVMAQHTTMKGSEIPQPLVDTYRELMKLKRLLNEKRG